LEELVRRGARAILQRALQAEVEQRLKEFAAVSLMDGRRLDRRQCAYWWVDGLHDAARER
jgi:hypothetical protein